MTTIKMTELTDALTAKGIKAIFTMSGGNTGTIYIGDADAEGYYEFAVGPSNYYRDEAVMGDFCWGIDGDEDATYYTGIESDFTVENLAHIIATAYWGSACGACGEWNHGNHECSEEALSCGACGFIFESRSEGFVAINQGFIEFTCHECKVVA